MRLVKSLRMPTCAGADHMDFTADGRLALVSCEFAGRMVVVDLRRERVVKGIALRAGAMPQDVKLSPDGRTFYVADMASNGVWLIDARRLRKDALRSPPAAAPTASTPAATRKLLYVSNREAGTITLISFRTRRPVRTWRIPGGGSPDMGGVSADGRVLWLSGRYDSEVYAISTRTGPPPAPHPRRARPARPVRLAPARALLDRAHRHPALSGAARRAGAPGTPPRRPPPGEPASRRRPRPARGAARAQGRGPRRRGRWRRRRVRRARRPLARLGPDAGPVVGDADTTRRRARRR